MKPEESIFADALEQAESERAGFVERACGDDLKLRQRVEALLRGYDGEGARLEDSPLAQAAGEVRAKPGEAPVDYAPGTRIGRYKILQKIGEGGCGVILMAEQTEPLHRRVAVKVIKLGMDTREVIARFEAERQALALMDHPNIARVLDAGATESGRPYFVMELVRGIPITRHCDEHRLGTEERIRLFIQVCHAIQHAHSKGIIHRDLKPSNILVTMHDGVAVPKIIDFGIAKATQGRLTDRTIFTAFEQFIGTPAYMSPEQTEMSALDVDTRSDIYSLGVLLYELLTGRTPFDERDVSRVGADAVRRMIREEEPAKPSTRFGTFEEATRTTVARLRGTEAAKLQSLLRGDLDWIVMRCLEKDRRRRYESASALALDIRHHLDDEPVAARPPSAAYRMRKFIRRHQPAFLAATGILAALVVGLIVSSVLFLRERVARSRAVEAEHAETQLRHEAEVGRDRETKRAARTALNLARQLLAEGKTADALAYFVHAARKDPGNSAIAARLA
ncbi:MAG TPA: serine/threonine-protein kinase, partial [Opitutaceae bacterium]